MDSHQTLKALDPGFSRRNFGFSYSHGGHSLVIGSPIRGWIYLVEDTSGFNFGTFLEHSLLNKAVYLGPNFSY